MIRKADGDIDSSGICADLHARRSFRAVWLIIIFLVSDAELDSKLAYFHRQQAILHRTCEARQPVEDAKAAGATRVQGLCSVAYPTARGPIVSQRGARMPRMGTHVRG